MNDDVNSRGASGLRFDYVCLNLTLMRLGIVIVQLIIEFK